MTDTDTPPPIEQFINSPTSGIRREMSSAGGNPSATVANTTTTAASGSALGLTNNSATTTTSSNVSQTKEHHSHLQHQQRGDRERAPNPTSEREHLQPNSGGGGGGSGMREYCLRWNNHQPNLVNFFGTLLQRESFVDVTLVSSEGKQIHAHKLVLSACSPYFQHVFENNPCKHPIVILKDIHFSDLRTIISFVYNGEVNISQDKINSILATASTLQIKGLAEVPADELKRVGGPRASDSSINERSRTQPPPLQSSSSWGSADAEDFGHGDIPRKKLKKSASAAGPSGLSSMSTNGENTSSAGGSFESGVGASMSRSLDDGTSLALDGSVRSPVTRPGPPPLTAGSQLSQQQKSRSLDIGIERDVNIDSELSSGGFSENQTYDDSSLGAERGVGGGKGRRGRLLIRQPRIKRLDNEFGRNGAELNLVEESSGGSDETMTIVATSTSQSQQPRESFKTGDENFSFSSSLARQQSIVPIVTVSESSPTPPSSPIPQPHPLVSDVTANRHTFSGGSGLGSRLMIPNVSESEDVRSHSSTSTLVKQLSQPHLPSQMSGSSIGLPRQHSTPSPSSMQATRLVYSGVKPGDLFQIVPTEGFHRKREEHDGSFLVDSSSILQIIPAGESSSGSSRVTFTSKGAMKEVEIFRRDLKRESSEGGNSESNLHSEDSLQGESLSIDESEGPLIPPLQRSGHCPALRPGPALGCNFCWNSVDKCGRILRRKTKYHCPECHINLCIVPCFQEYHEKADKKKSKGSKLLIPKPSSM